MKVANQTTVRADASVMRREIMDGCLAHPGQHSGGVVGARRANAVD
jgi:hypothetical protein